MDCKLCTALCCKKHWLVKLEPGEEKLFKTTKIYFDGYIFTDECEHLKNDLCTIHNDKPKRCKEFDCDKETLL